MLEQHTLRKKIEIYSITLLIILVGIYGCFLAYPLIVGPRITIYSPNDNDTVPGTTFEISGKVSRIKEITIQGRPIPVDEDGYFREILVSSLPYTEIVITATDSYGKSIVKTLRVIPKE